MEVERRWDVLVIWTFGAGGLALMLPRLVNLSLLEHIPYLQFLLFLPAVVVGGIRYLVAPSEVRALPMIMFISVMGVGFLWVDATERGRGMVELALVATPLPLAVLIRRRREWLIAVFTYILASTVAASYLFYAWLGQAERTGLNTYRYGGLYDDRIMRIMDPNITATHLGFGVLLTAILWIAPPLGLTARRWRLACTACLPVLLAGVALSASRGGTLSLLGAVALLAMFTSIRRALPLRTNVLGGIGLLAMAALLFLIPGPLSQRLTSEAGSGAISDTWDSNAADAAGASGSSTTSDMANPSSTTSFGGRIAIWQSAMAASGSSLDMLLVGAGTGGADHAIASANPDLAIAKVGEHNVLRANAHSSYFYWLVSFGVIGVMVAAVALALVVLYALGNDWSQNWGAGTAMLAFFLLTSVTLIAMRLETTSIAISALTLGYVLPRPERKNTCQDGARVTPALGS